MHTQCPLSGALAALAFGIPLLAQTTSPPNMSVTPIFLQQSFTTGMVGFTTNQTARLNVFNLNSNPASTTVTQIANCTIELQFFDDKNNLVKQTVVPNFAPGTATSLDLSRASVTSETSARAEIRGVVVVNPSPTPIASPVAMGYCSVFTTLEIFDANSVTVALTSDTRAVGLPIMVPVMAERPR